MIIYFEEEISNKIPVVNYFFFGNAVLPRVFARCCSGGVGTRGGLCCSTACGASNEGRMLVSVENRRQPGFFRAVVRGTGGKESSAQPSPPYTAQASAMPTRFSIRSKRDYVVNDSVYHFGAAAGSRAPIDR
jgi:hypothetical protein